MIDGLEKSLREHHHQRGQYMHERDISVAKRERMCESELVGLLTEMMLKKMFKKEKAIFLILRMQLMQVRN